MIDREKLKRALQVVDHVGAEYSAGCLDEKDYRKALYDHDDVLIESARAYLALTEQTDEATKRALDVLGEAGQQLKSNKSLEGVALFLSKETFNTICAALLNSQGWQPIETAPKDGTPILCIHKSGHINILMHKTSEDDETPRWRRWQHNEYHFWEPTHWQPLPAPPVITSDAQNGGE